MSVLRRRHSKAKSLKRQEGFFKNHFNFNEKMKKKKRGKKEKKKREREREKKVTDIPSLIRKYCIIKKARVQLVTEPTIHAFLVSSVA